MESDDHSTRQGAPSRTRPAAALGGCAGNRARRHSTEPLSGPEQRQSRDARPRDAPPGRPVRAAPAIPLAIIPEHLNADVPVTAIASANQASLRFGDARVDLEGTLDLDSDKSVPGLRVAAWPHLSVHRRLLECPAHLHHRLQRRSSGCRRACRPGGHRLVPSRFLDACWEAARPVREVFLQVRGKPDAQAPPGVCRVPRWPCSSAEEAGHGSLRLEPSA